MHLTWLEISKKALHKNIQAFRKLVGPQRILGVAVKGNAYGHGLLECSKIFLEAGVDYLCVNDLWEAEILRKNDIKSPIYIMGYTQRADLKKVFELKCDLVVYDAKTIQILGEFKKPVSIHLKIETGNHRQGVNPEDLPKIIKLLKKYPSLKLIGLSTHFADLEDRIYHKYASEQLSVFKKSIDYLKKNGLEPKYIHCANSAATILLEKAYFNFVRVGIGAYGLWPSEKTRQSAEKSKIDIQLSPVLRWKTMVAQVKEVKKGALIGYGGTYKMPEDGHIAVLPVGYYDGFDRGLSNKGIVLIKGQRAPVVGRVCMNMIMVNVSHIPKVQPEDEVVLIGKQGDQEMTAEEIAELTGTINYEIMTRLNETLERKIIEYCISCP